VDEVMTMTKTTKTALAIVVTTVGLVVGGCAHVMHASTPAGTTSATYAGALTRDADFASMSFDFAPPTAAQVAAVPVTPDQALAACSQPGVGCPSGQAKIYLVVATTPDLSSENIRGKLAYLMVWTDNACVRHGPVAVPGDAGTLPPASTSCTSFELVDAGTGQSLGFVTTSDPASAQLAASMS
jgi:hypothetical protein